MGYSDDDMMVRVDFFKETGKWYTTEAVRWLYYGIEENRSINTKLPMEVFKASLRKHFEDQHRLGDMIAVCLKPTHEYSYPLMIRKVDDIWE
jgi:hypothetical protein